MIDGPVMRLRTGSAIAVSRVVLVICFWGKKDEISGGLTSLEELSAIRRTFLLLSFACGAACKYSETRTSSQAAHLDCLVVLVQG